MIYVNSAMGLALLYVCTVTIKWDAINLIKLISRGLFPIIASLFLILILVSKKIQLLLISLTLIFSLGWAYFLRVYEAQELETHYIITTEKIEKTKKIKKEKKRKRIF